MSGPTRPELPGVLAIDAGNSKTDAALVATDGTVLGVARGGPFRPQRGHSAEAVAVLDEVVAKVCSNAGLATHRPAARQVSACLANADLPVEVASLTEAIAAQGWATGVEVFNDTFALLRSGLDEWRGVAVVCGAGINCTGVLPDGRTARFAALGHISGDWGGGGHLWQEAMWWAARAEDGRGPDTALCSALPAHFGLGSMAALIEAVHLETIPEERCLELTPVLFEVADAGDPVTITWSFVPDGTPLPANPGAAANSNLFARMDALFGAANRATWNLRTLSNHRARERSQPRRPSRMHGLPPRCGPPFARGVRARPTPEPIARDRG